MIRMVNNRTRSSLSRLHLFAAMAVLGTAIPGTTACGESAPLDSTPERTTVHTVIATETTFEVATATPTASPEGDLIPDVVGLNHQLAQDTMQAAGFYVLKEGDATGQDRLIVWDRNWVVVSQNPPAGERASRDTVITLSAKKKTDP